MTDEDEYAKRIGRIMEAQFAGEEAPRAERNGARAQDEYLAKMDRAIESELYGGAPLPEEPYSGKGEKNASRTAFRLHDFDPPRDKQMAVFTHAKKLSEYIFVITEKSPVKLRWSIVSRLINCSVDVIEFLYRANYERDEAARSEWQKKAMVSLSLLDFYTETAKTKQAINFRQMTLIAEQIQDVKKLLSGWVRATRKK